MQENDNEMVNQVPVVSAPVLFDMNEDDGFLRIHETALLANATDGDLDTLTIQNLTVDSGALIYNAANKW